MLSNRIRRLAPPPRPVPLPVICAAMQGITGSFGAIFLISGLVGTLVFTAGFRPIDEVRLAFSQTTARGIITGVYDTNSTENDVPVYEYAYRFTTRKEETASGRSYTTGREFSVEDRVTVEYVPEDPSISRIQGARMSEFTPWVLFILLFPAIGGTMFLGAAIGGWRQVQLLRHGAIADARITSTRETSTQINDVPVVEYSYEIQTGAGEVFQGKSKALPSGRIGDEEPEPALYLPAKPSRSILVDAITLSYPLDVDGLSGQWISQGGKTQVALYVLTWAAAAALGGLWILRLFGILR
jgi:hypothetical protein